MNINYLLIIPYIEQDCTQQASAVTWFTPGDFIAIVCPLSPVRCWPWLAAGWAECMRMDGIIVTVTTLH